MTIFTRTADCQTGNRSSLNHFVTLREESADSTSNDLSCGVTLYTDDIAIGDAFTSMNARKNRGEIHLRTDCPEFPEDWFERPQFQETFFKEPCKGCGSSHSLLREIGRMDDAPIYEYRCNVIDPSALYQNNNLGPLKIHFRLGTFAFSQDCGYNLDEALRRLKIIKGGRSGDSEVHSIYDSFANEVRSLCVDLEVRRTRG